MLFSKRQIPEKLPGDMQKAVDELKKSNSKEDCLRKAYDIITAKFRGNRVKTYTHLYQAFIQDVDVLWKKQGFLHCANFTYLLFILLVKSGFFKEEDIEYKKTLVWYISPHQYLRVRINSNKFINVDAWGKAYGIKFGDYARGFH